VPSMSDHPYVHALVLDCPEPRKSADFYADLLGYRVAYADDEWVTVTGPGPMLAFQLAPDHVAPTWPDNSVPQQMHLDFFVADIAAAHQRVLDLGGRAVDPTDPPSPSPERGFRVYADPAGHTFCLCRPSKTSWS
jgi:catechol 2,3-dioxygenase-like lactoylglutathione lyase family enzyme